MGTPGYKQATVLGASAESAYGDGTITPASGVLINVEGDSFNVYPQPTKQDIERQVGVQEAPERLQAQYNVTGTMDALLYPGSADTILDWALARTGSPANTKSYAWHRYTGFGGVGTLNYQKHFGSKVRRMTVAFDKDNPLLRVTLDIQSQKDTPYDTGAAADIPAAPTAQVYEFIRAWSEFKNDQTPGTSAMTDVLRGSFSADNSLEDDGRKPDIDTNPTDPTKWANILTGQTAGLVSVSGSVTLRPTSDAFLNMVQDNTVGSMYFYAMHRTAKAVKILATVAANATALFVDDADVTTAGLAAGDVIILRDGSPERIEALEVIALLGTTSTSISTYQSISGAATTSSSLAFTGRSIIVRGRGNSSNVTRQSQTHSASASSAATESIAASAISGARVSHPAAYASASSVSSGAVPVGAAYAYTQGLEFVIPGLSVDTAPLKGAPKNAIIQDIAFKDEATSGQNPILWAVSDTGASHFGSYLYGTV